GEGKRAGKVVGRRLGAVRGLGIWQNRPLGFIRLLDSQQSDKSKTGLGYDSQGIDSQVLANQVSDSEDEDEIETESKQIKPSFAKEKFVKSTKHVKSPRKSVNQEESNSGCSRHMTGNKSFLTDYQNIDGVFVAFGGSPKEGKITGKGKIRTGKLDFKDVYFVKELKFNIFSVLQMCDKKNSVLFTKTECLVLSPDFKLLDENQVLLKVPRHNNMYSFNLKNAAPSGGLTCLFVKDTIDESNLWHRRLGHINFKTMNKLNKVLVTKPQNKTPYELLIGRSPNIDFMKPFGCPITILNTLDYLGKFEGKADEGFLVGYFVNSKAFREGVLNGSLILIHCMPTLEETGIFDDAYDDREVGAEADTNNLEPLTVVYVDDIIFGSTKKLLCDEFEQMMHKRFQMSFIRELTFFLGLQVKQKDDGFFISQDKYVADILKKFNFTTVKTPSTLMEPNKALIKDVEAEDVDVHLYRLMIGLLMYLTASRPDIMFAVCACARFQVTPKTSHLHAVKRIFRYLKGIHLLLPDLISFLEKPTESDGFEKNVKTVNEDVRIQALVYGKKVIVNEASIRRDLRSDDPEGTDCLPNSAIFEELARMSTKTTAWNKFSSTMTSAIICLANNQKFNFSKYIFESMMKNLEVGVKFLMYPRFFHVFINNQLGDMSHHKGIFVNPSLTKKVFANMKRVGTSFSGAITPLFETMMVQAPEEVGEIPTDTQDTPILTQPSPSQPQRKHKSRRKKRKETEVSQDETQTKEHIPTPSYDPLPSGDDRLQLNKLMEICTKLSDRVLSLEQINTNQAATIEKLKRRVKKLEGKKKKRTHGLKRLYKVSLSARIISSDEEAGENVEHDATVAEKEVSTAADEVVTIADDTEITIAATTLQISKDDVTLAQTLIEIKDAKPKALTPAAKTITAVSTRPKEKGIIIDLEAQMQADLVEEQRIAKQKEEEANIAMIAE
nr:uncharacterized mitochondrial protein AtMg00810-like [Tanacetum cinerariifolium]